MTNKYPSEVKMPFRQHELTFMKILRLIISGIVLDTGVLFSLHRWVDRKKLNKDKGKGIGDWGGKVNWMSGNVK